MDIIKCIEYCEHFGIDVTDAKKEIEALRDTLEHVDNAMLDYVERLEKQGSTMGYGRNVLNMVSIARMILNDK